MAKRLIDADTLEADLKRQYNEVYGNARKTVNPDDFFIDRCAAYRASVVEAEQKGFFEYLKTRPTVDAVELPCKIGDYVWAIRNFKGHKHPQRGVVSDMYFTRDMELSIVVKYVARGKWGETVFATDAEAYAVINGERKEG